jgi:MFS family permease
MNPIERTATLSLASIFMARMLGLFMVLPVLSLYAQQLKGATPTLIGLAIGIYGITQASLQIPCGMLSDRYNRKIIIAYGLIVFILGSIIAATADSISQMIIGRALQGASAIGGATIALASDLTRETERPKVMAIIGITIGGSFSLAMMLGPLLNQWIDVDGIFWISAGLGLAGLGILSFIVQSLSSWQQFTSLLRNPALARLNIGVFILHAILTANFVILPLLLGHQHHYIYIPVLLVVLVLMLPLLRLAQRKTWLEPLSLGAIALLIISEIVLKFSGGQPGIIYIGIGLILFFTAFTFLEASLPSLISQIAPAQSKGGAMGIYTCSQFLGMFAGGMGAGWIYGHGTVQNVFMFCAILATLWLLMGLTITRKLHPTAPPP